MLIFKNLDANTQFNEFACRSQYSWLMTVSRVKVNVRIDNMLSPPIYNLSLIVSCSYYLIQMLLGFSCNIYTYIYKRSHNHAKDYDSHLHLFSYNVVQIFISVITLSQNPSQSKSTNIIMLEQIPGHKCFSRAYDVFL